MSILELLILLIIAGICGAVAQLIVGYSTGGIVTSIVVGFVGAMIGVFIVRELNVSPVLPVRIENQEFPVFWAIVGSVIFVAVLAMLTRGRRETIVRR